MYRFAVVSDSHRRTGYIRQAAEKFKDVDAIIHLGDIYPDSEKLRELTGKPIHAVRGNCDCVLDGVAEAKFTCEGVRILLVHGDAQKVKFSLFRLSLYAQEQQCDLALFGHTHVPTREDLGSVTLINPGALAKGQYAILELDDGIIHAEFHDLDRENGE